jgi:hypothetical protein
MDNSQIAQSTFSFKVLTECPIIIALLFQLYRSFVTSNVPGFVEPIIVVRAPFQIITTHSIGINASTLSATASA